MLRLGSACEKIGSGATPRGGESVYLERGVALIRSQNVHNDGFHREGLVFIGPEHAAELAGVEVRSDDVLLNITGNSVARSCLVPDDLLPARVNQHVAIVRPRSSELDARFLRYWFVHPDTQGHLLALAGAGATRDALTKGMLEDLLIDAPPIADQRAIGEVLRVLDSKIELNRRLNRALEGLAASFFGAALRGELDAAAILGKVASGELASVTKSAFEILER